VIKLRQTLKVLLASFLLLLTGASVAAASSKQDTFFEAPRDLTSRGSTPASRDAAFATLDSLGIKALRVNLRWLDVAPSPDASTKPAFDATDPAAYNWNGFADTIDKAKARGWKVLISPSGEVPKWATAAGADYVTRPKPAEFELFTTAVAKRFGGPNVIWSIWNEPNLPRFLKPQTVAGKPASGRIYRELYLAGQRGIAAGGQGSAPILFGETAPVGSSKDGRIKPIAFLRDALCLSRSYKKDKACAKIVTGGVAHHPYRSIQGIPKSQDDVTYQVMSRLTKALDKAAKAGAIDKKRSVYMTEFGIQSSPDKFFGVPVQQQLEERARAERMAYFSPRIRGFSQYLLTDDDAAPGVKGYGRNPGFESGLRYATGKDKPSLKAFRLTLDVKRIGRKLSIWGLVRPATAKTTVVLERRLKGGKFKTWKKASTKANGSFTASDAVRSGVQYRYRWTSPTGKLTSPYVRVFKDV
jgi:hypothetical protein